MPTFLSFLAGVLLGGGACYGLFEHTALLGVYPGEAFTGAAGKQLKLSVKLHRFQLKPNSLGEFDDWVLFEQHHHAETVATLEREAMYTEAIFRDRKNDPETIFWLEIHGPQGASEANSPLEIDKIYDHFMAETLVPHSRVTMLPEYTLLPSFLLDAIAAHEDHCTRTTQP